MVLKRVAFLAICAVLAIAEEQPKYGGNFEPSNADYLSSIIEPSDTTGASAAGTVSFNETNSADTVINTILQSGRQGRNLDGFDEVYSDPTVQEALQKGDDRQARNVIKDKLCSLGLMECENEQVEGKRPFLPPGELIYSQPPPGYRRPPPPQQNGAYGPARPVQQSNNGNKYNGPPRKVGYSGSPFPVNGPNYQNRPPGPIYVESKPPGPFYEGPNPPGPIYQGSRPPSSGQIFEGPKPPGPIFEDNSSPYKFDTVSSSYQVDKYEHIQDFHGPPKPTIVVNAQGGAATSAGQTAAASSVNIHHHYHHLDNDAAKGPAIVVNPISSTQGASFVSGNSLSASSEFSSTGGFSPISSGYDYNNNKQVNGEYGGVNSGLGPVNGLSGNGIYSGANSYKPISEPGNNLIGTSGYDGSINSYGGVNGGSSFGGGSNTQYGQSVSGVFNGNQQESFHSQNPGYYKKALNTNGGPNSLSSYSQANYNKFNGQSSTFNNGAGQFNGQSQFGQGAAGQFGQNAGQFGQNGGQYNTGENYQGFETSRRENLDCVCVPYEQCPSQDVIGRKDDLILPLDPRNLKTDIEALEDEVVITDGNGTMSAVRIPKEIVSDKKIEGDKDDAEKKVNANDETITNDKKDEVKKISKREAEATDKKLDDGDDIDQADGEARLLGLGGIGLGGVNGYGGGYGGVGAYGGGGPLVGKKVIPTFGVSFGLPYPTNAYGGYPLNPYGAGPAQNPYFGSISPNGLNLGLINVNPLVSFQVAKNELGEKLFKPLVNLHVTPNENIIQKVGALLKAKKFGFGGGSYPTVNQHYHTHTHYPNPPEIYHPHHHHHEPHSPQIYEGPGYPSGPNSGYYPSGPGSYPGGPGGYPGGSSGYPTGGGGGGYGFPGPQGYYRDSSNNANSNDAADSYANQPQYDYNSNDYYSSRNFDNVTNDGQSQNLLAYTYQNVYPQNQQLQSNGPPSAYADYESYNQNNRAQQQEQQTNSNNPIDAQQGANSVSFPNSRRKRRSIDDDSDDTKAKSATEIDNKISSVKVAKRQAYYQQQLQRPQQQCGPRQVCCRRPQRPPQISNPGQCGRRNTQGITGRIKNPVYVDGDSEFGEYPWQVAILKKDPKESVYICGGTLIDQQHILTAAHCVKTYTNYDLRVRLGEWDVNHDVEFFPYVERDVVSVIVHPEYYAGTLDNDLAIIRLNSPIDFANAPHISPACLPDKFSDFTGARCWTTGWGKDAFGDFGKYQNILKEVDVPIIGQQQCQQQLRNTRLGYGYKLNPGFVCAGGEEGKDACKGDGGGPMVCERSGVWQLVGVVSWGIGCGQVNVPGVYVRVSHYLDWIQQNTHRF